MRPVPVRVKVEKVLMAAGRALNVENNGFEAAGVKLTDRGFVQVDYGRGNDGGHRIFGCRCLVYQGDIAAQHDHLARTEGSRLTAKTLAIDETAVRATHVLKFVAAGFQRQFGVMARDLCVIQDDI